MELFRLLRQIRFQLNLYSSFVSSKVICYKSIIIIVWVCVCYIFLIHKTNNMKENKNKSKFGKLFDAFFWNTLLVYNAYITLEKGLGRVR